MPIENGWEFLDWKAATPAVRTIPVIIESGWIEIPQPIPDGAGVVSHIVKGPDLFPQLAAALGIELES
jgi:hypothetical protein